MGNWGYNPTRQFGGSFFFFRQEIQQYNKQLFEIFQQFAWAVAVTRPQDEANLWAFTRWQLPDTPQKNGANCCFQEWYDWVCHMWLHIDFNNIFLCLSFIWLIAFLPIQTRNFWNVQENWRDRCDVAYKSEAWYLQTSKLLILMLTFYVLSAGSPKNIYESWAKGP